MYMFLHNNISLFSSRDDISGTIVLCTYAECMQEREHKQIIISSIICNPFLFGDCLIA